MTSRLVVLHFRKSFLDVDSHSPWSVSKGGKLENDFVDPNETVQDVVYEYEVAAVRTGDDEDRSFNTFLMDILAYKYAYLNVSLFSMITKHRGRQCGIWRISWG